MLETVSESGSLAKLCELLLLSYVGEIKKHGQSMASQYKLHSMLTLLNPEYHNLQTNTNIPDML